MSPKEQLRARIESRQALIGIIGLGYVGLPLMLAFSESGFRVLGFDINEEVVNTINAGRTHIKHISADAVRRAVDEGSAATSDFSRISEVDAIIICVPTPLNVHREPDISFIVSTMQTIAPHLRAGQLISLESTTYPGTTEEEIVPRVRQRGFAVGEDIFVVYSPEREDPGNARYTTRTIPKVCGGVTQTCLQLGVLLYEQVIEQVVPVSSTRAAELTKLLENIHRAINIGLVNELKLVADRMGLDIYEVIRAAATKPFGFTPYYPGPGLGGHCIPIDPFYLTWKAREYGVHTRFIELAGEINSAMPDYVVEKVVRALNEHEKPVKGSTILILGIAYKKNVDDARESPSVVIMEKLRDLGARLQYSDPYFPVFPRMRCHHFDLQSIPLTAQTLRAADCVVLATDHDDYDYDLILREAPLIVDTRGRFPLNDPKVFRA